MSYATYTQTLHGTTERLGLHPALTKLSPSGSEKRKPVLGSWMMFPGAAVARCLGGLGYDFVLVDCEHGNIDDAQMHIAVSAIAREGCSPIVRIAAPESYLVKRALDAGAHGLLAPLMSTAEECAKFVSYAKFPATKATLAKDPTALTGVRGAGSPFAPAVFGQTLADYVATANSNTFIGVQIETVEGLNNVEAIAAVPGIDMLFIGPNDLCSSMGYPATEHADIHEVQEAIKRILAATKKAGKVAGMFCTSAEQVRQRFEQGFDLLNLGFDVQALSAWNSEEKAKLKDIL